MDPQPSMLLSQGLPLGQQSDISVDTSDIVTSSDMDISANVPADFGVTAKPRVAGSMATDTAIRTAAIVRARFMPSRFGERSLSTAPLVK
jgi:hypothetical protein